MEMRFRVTSSARIASLALASMVMLSAATAASATTELLSGLSASVARAANKAEILPKPSGKPSPYRQIVFGECGVAAQAPEDTCRYKMAKVGEGKLLEIANIACYATYEAGGVVMTDSPKYNELESSVVAIIPAVNELVNATNARGPYYFKAGERPVFWANSYPSAVTNCAIYGSLYNID